MKRLSVALAAIGLTAACGAFAAMPAATDPTLVNVPQLPGGFYIGASALYLQPSATNGDLDYASVNTGSTAAGFNSKLYSVDPSYDWGFDVEAGYIFANTGNNVELKYTYLDSGNDTDHVDLPAGGSITLAGNNNVANNGAFADGLGIVHAAGKSDYRLNQVDLTAGQLINVGCRLHLQPTVGIRYADLERNFTVYSNTASAVNSLGTATAGNQFETDAEQSDFTGAGPMAGLNASYYVGMGVGVVAHADAALLVGTIDAETDSTFVNAIAGGATTTTNYVFKNDSVSRIVPIGDMKLGADYTYLFNNAANSDLTLELGWQFSHYYNAVDSLITSYASSNGSGTAGSISGSESSDVGFQGPYINLTFHA